MLRSRLMAWFAGLFVAAPLLAVNIDNDESIEKLRLVKFAMPEIPAIVLETGDSQGVVTVAIGRDAEGLVNDVLVLDSTHARLTGVVVKAVKQWQFARPSNVQISSTQIVPIVRFFFSSRGIVLLPTASKLTTEVQHRDFHDNPPVVLPTFADLDHVPQPVHQPMPTFTGAQAQRFMGGSATVRFFVDETGKARVPIVLETTSLDLGNAVVAAVEQWMFDPPRAAGRPTIAVVTETITFAAPTR
jgi:hypothetical protein